MLKREIVSHFSIALIWLLAISILWWNLGSNIGPPLESLFFLWLGGLAGTVFPDLDQLVYCLFSYPNEFNSLRVKRLVEQQKLGELVVFLAKTAGERVRLSFHNALFQTVLVILCFFVLTSSGSLFGKGLVMAMALHLLKDEIELLSKKKEEVLRRWLFWPIKMEISFETQKHFVLLMTLAFLGLNLLLI